MADDIAEIKTNLGIDPLKTFDVPEEVYDIYASTIATRGKEAHESWTKTFKSYAGEYPDAHGELTRRINNDLPRDWQELLPKYEAGAAAVGGRKYSEHVLNALAGSFPELIGGSADLTSSNYTRVLGAEDFQPPELGIGSYAGSYIRYGVREHAMGAIMNGLSAYGGFIPFAGTFLNFVSCFSIGAQIISADSTRSLTLRVLCAFQPFLDIK